MLAFTNNIYIRIHNTYNKYNMLNLFSIECMYTCLDLTAQDWIKYSGLILGEGEERMNIVEASSSICKWTGRNLVCGELEVRGEIRRYTITR